MVQLGGAGIAGGYGYVSGEGSTGQRIERGLGFAAGAGLGLSKRFRGNVAKQFGTGARAMQRFGIGKGGAMMAGRAFGGLGGTARGAAVGAMYGALDEDTTILGGAAAGAGAVMLGKGAMRGWSKGHRLGVRTGAAAGGAVGAYAGGPVGMAIGAGLGGAAGGIARFARRFPRTAKGAGAAALVGGMSTAIVGGAAANAYAMHQQPRQTNYGADGDLALGLHAMRHG